VPTTFPYAGEVYSLLCAIFWAFAVVLFRKSGERVPPVALNLFKGAFALALFVPTMLVLGTPFLPADQTRWDWGVLLLSGVIGIGVADTLFFASLNRLGAGGSAIVDCLYSPMVVLSSFVYLGEPLGWGIVFGMSLMMGAILVGTWAPAQARTEAQRNELLIGTSLGALSMVLMAVGIVLAKPVLDGAPVLWSTTVRLAGGVLFLALHAALPGERAAAWAALRPSRSWRVTVPAALLGTYLSLIVWIAGMKYTQASRSGIINQSSTLIIPLLAAVFLKEPLTRRKVGAVLLGFAGVMLVTLWR
jgi:drug/metabolite transporter (DMT)-like permease